ncbi:hypothetical protein Bbelb_282700 [Branchiostoma belcheri]|nr:hypothetical protein Bbelb_282700 [Branchiostoma belcheri]
MVQNSSKALMWEGLCHLARRDCVREGDGPASIGTWQLDFVQFLKNKHHKYFIIAHQTAYRNQGLPACLIWNRTGNIKGVPDRDVGLDLINEFLNNDSKAVRGNIQGKLALDIPMVPNETPAAKHETNDGRRVEFALTGCLNLYYNLFGLKKPDRVDSGQGHSFARNLYDDLKLRNML